MRKDDAGLAGMRFVLTGATGGIGTVIATTLARHGAALSLVGRKEEALAHLVDRLDPPAVGEHVAEAFDITVEDRWEQHAEKLCPEGKGLDGLVLAAAVLGPIGPIGSWSAVEFRQTVETNLLGTVIPLTVLLERLSARRGSVVTFSGGGATSPLRRYDAYASSKAAVVRFTENVGADLSTRGIRVNAVAPGFVVTPMHDATIAAGREAVGEPYFDKTAAAVAAGAGDSPQHAADLTAFLLSGEATGITGRLISAVWDPWRNAGFQDRLRSEPDLATLRRIDDQFFAPLHKPT